MEQQTNEIIALLQKKRLIFEEYEAVTDILSEAADIDIMEDYITKRAGLANKIDELDSAIKILSEQTTESGVKLALRQSTLRESLPEELRQIYDCNRQILDIIRRVRLKNTDITADYQRLRGELSDKIKETSNMPKINKYLNNLSSPHETNNFGSV